MTKSKELLLSMVEATVKVGSKLKLIKDLPTEDGIIVANSIVKVIKINSKDYDIVSIDGLEGSLSIDNKFYKVL